MSFHCGFSMVIVGVFRVIGCHSLMVLYTLNLIMEVIASTV